MLEIEQEFSIQFSIRSEKVVQKKQTGVKHIKEESSKVNTFTKNIVTEPKESGSSVNIKLPSKT